MPHFTIEDSANLDARVDMGAVVELVRKAAVESGVFPLGGIRVRAIRCEHYAIADGRPDLGFLDMVLRLGEGRDLATRKKAGEHIFRVVRSSRSGVCAKPVRAVVRHADQRQANQLEAQQHPRTVYDRTQKARPGMTKSS
jgi:5-carboxymethyl-2-hydroxymuconate isomerase